jgi:hypothetical protein
MGRERGQRGTREGPERGQREEERGEREGIIYKWNYFQCEIETAFSQNISSSKQ